MKHCTIDQLTDHLLGGADEQTTEHVTGHLTSGCERCTRLLAGLAMVRQVGRFDATHEPPEGIVRTVKALTGVPRERRRERSIAMRLSFDSLLAPAPAGARSLHSSSRHLVFYSQNFALDLRMDFERSVRDMVVVGQLLNRDWGPLADVPAYLVSGERVLSHSTTGRLGEFHMECRPQGPMNLRLEVNDDELIDVELDRRRQGELRPVLMERDEVADSTQVPDSIHSRSSDRAH